jgi:hypothetical protein
MDLPELSRTGSLHEILTQPDRARPAAKWFIRQGILPHLQAARDIQEEDTAGSQPFQSLNEWT